jgi:predicted ferric reductase
MKVYSHTQRFNLILFMSSLKACSFLFLILELNFCYRYNKCTSYGLFAIPILFNLFQFLVGWGANQNIQGFGEQPSVKSQVLNLVRSIRTVMRIPLIFLSILTIVFKLMFG